MTLTPKDADHVGESNEMVGMTEEKAREILAREDVATRRAFESRCGTAGTEVERQKIENERNQFRAEGFLSGIEYRKREQSGEVGGLVGDFRETLAWIRDVEKYLRFHGLWPNDEWMRQKEQTLKPFLTEAGGEGL